LKLIGKKRTTAAAAAAAAARMRIRRKRATRIILKAMECGKSDHEQLIFQIIIH